MNDTSPSRGRLASRFAARVTKQEEEIQDFLRSPEGQRIILIALAVFFVALGWGLFK